MIVTGPVPPARGTKVQRGRPDPEKYFTFSFRYWDELGYFGVGSTAPTWFRSLLARLKDLGGVTISRLLMDPSFKDAMRFHTVDWDAHNIPIRLQDLHWLPPTVRENQEEFPIVQFHVSKALGRVHGFWDRDWCFQIVLLDPLHNLQPSKYNAYKLQTTTPSGCRYSALRAVIDRACGAPCSHSPCDFARRVSTIEPDSADGQVVIVAALEERVASALAALSEKKNVSVSEILEFGIEFFGE